MTGLKIATMAATRSDVDAVAGCLRASEMVCACRSGGSVTGQKIAAMGATRNLAWMPPRPNLQQLPLQCHLLMRLARTATRFPVSPTEGASPCSGCVMAMLIARTGVTRRLVAKMPRGGGARSQSSSFAKRTVFASMRLGGAMGLKIVPMAVMSWVVPTRLVRQHSQLSLLLLLLLLSRQQLLQLQA